mgnify:CR=1 FL=1
MKKWAVTTQMVAKLAAHARAKASPADCRAGFVPHATGVAKSAKTADPPLPNENFGGSVNGRTHVTHDVKCEVQVLAPRFLRQLVIGLSPRTRRRRP